MFKKTNPKQPKKEAREEGHSREKESLNNMVHGKVNIVMDGQWGSTGKGKLVGYLALRNDINAAMCDFMSNAGHTFVDDNGKKTVVCQLPMSVVNTDCVLLINPGAAITVDRLEKELDEYSNYKPAERLFIHPNVAVIEDVDREVEKRTVDRISSTLKGCGGSLSRKVMRVAKLASEEPRLSKYIADTTRIVHNILKSGGTVMLEGAQGFDLSINHGHKYPYTTSRDITTMSILNNAGVPPWYLGDCYGSIRTFPIRVGNTYDEKGNMVGNSGPYYSDQKELTWDEVQRMSGSLVPIVERTTVTNKIRRVFTFSYAQIARFIMICAPTKLFINFINHVNCVDKGKRSMSELSPESILFVSELKKSLNSFNDGVRCVPTPDISHIGTGEKDSDMIVWEE